MQAFAFSPMVEQTGCSHSGTPPRGCATYLTTKYLYTCYMYIRYIVSHDYLRGMAGLSVLFVLPPVPPSPSSVSRKGFAVRFVVDGMAMVVMMAAVRLWNLFFFSVFYPCFAFAPRFVFSIDFGPVVVVSVGVYAYRVPGMSYRLLVLCP